MLARHLAYDFPQYFPYFGTAGFNYKGVYYPTHDNLIGRYPGADGIKTGYVGASGFNLTSSVVRDGVHLIGIVMGGRTAVRRDQEMMHLLDTEVRGHPGQSRHGRAHRGAMACRARGCAAGGHGQPYPCPGRGQHQFPVRGTLGCALRAPSRRYG